MRSCFSRMTPSSPGCAQNELRIGPEPGQQIIRHRRDRVVPTKALVKSLLVVAHPVLLKSGGTGDQTSYYQLLNPDRITTADCAAPLNGSIHTDVDLVMLGRRAQDSRIPREPPAREWSSHNARTDW